MKNLKLFLALLVCFTCSQTAFSQQKISLDFLDNAYQSCQDTGSSRLYCAQIYYTQLDSVLNVVYLKYRATLNTKAKDQLKAEQLKWLATRDIYFKEVTAKYKNDPDVDSNSEDTRMIITDEKAQFVRKRVKYFLDKLYKS